MFSVQNFCEKGVGKDGEIRQGRHLVDAAVKARVRHYVQSTMASARGAEAVQHFAARQAVEALVRDAEIAHTFIGTVWFIDNLLNEKLGGEASFAALKGSLGLDRPMEMLAVDDIGAVVQAVFAARDACVGRHINVAGVKLSVAGMVEQFRHVVDRRPPGLGFPNPPVPNWVLGFFSPDFAAQLRWQRAVGWKFSLDEAKEIYPRMTSFAEFLAINRDRFL